MMMRKISKNISYVEAVKSNTAIKKGINNHPSPTIIKAMKNTANNIFQPIREFFKVPIAVTSFFRSEELNLAIGGSKTSQHITGEAIDLDAHVFGKITNAQIFNFIKNNLEFDQLIWEFGNKKEPAWVHVSLSYGGKNRKNILRAYKTKNIFGKTITKYEKIN